jgi:preprotein translocase subunit SecE
MNDEVKQQNAGVSPVDNVKVVAAILIALGGIVGYYVLKSRPETWAPWASLFGGFALGLIVFATSQYARNFWQFVLDSRVELRKVFWPSRQETFTTTAVVLVFVVVASLFFWLLDLSLASLTRFFTGRGS